QALVSQGGDALRELTGDLEDAGGTAKTMADKQMQGLSGAMLLMKSAAESVAISIGDTGLLDNMTSLATGFAELMQDLSKTNPAFLKFAVVVAAVAAAIGPLLLVTGMLISSIGAIAGVFAGVTAAVAAPIAVFALLA